MSWPSFIFESKSEYHRALARVAASVLVVVGCLFGLSTAGIAVGWKLEVAYASLALGLVCFVEINWRPKTPIPVIYPPSDKPTPEMSNEEFMKWREERNKELMDRAEKEHGEAEQEQQRRRVTDWAKSLIELAFLIGLAFLTAQLAHSGTPPGRPGSVIKPPSVPDNGPKLSPCQNDLQKANAELQQCKSTLDQMAKNSDLEKKILDYLQQHPPNPPVQPPSNAPVQPPASPPTQASPSTFSLSLGEILILVILLIAVVMIGRKHKEAVPVAGAAGLALEALKHAPELAKMNEYMYGRVLWAFLIVSGVLTVMFLAAAVLELWARAAAPPADSPASQDDVPKKMGFLKKTIIGILGGPDDKSQGKENYISSLGFSVIVLLWATVMVGYRAHGTENPTKNEHASSGILESEPLASLRPFKESKTELRDSTILENWKKYLTARNMNPGDILLLVGSADCKPFRHGGDGLDNPKLAQNRAQAVSEWLKPEMDSRGVRVEVVPLDQHKSCRESEELRAVYAFLIHGAQQRPAFH